MQSEVFEQHCAIRIKYFILSHLNTNESPTIEALKPYYRIDHDWYKMCCSVLARYKNAHLFMKEMTNLEFGLSFHKFDQTIINQVCFPSPTNKIHVNKPLLCVEPQIESSFIDNFIQTFMGIDCSNGPNEFTSLNILTHNYLHKVWLKASKLEVRTQKSLSGLVETSLSDEYDLSCKCPKNYLSDTYIFKNYKINMALQIKIYYMSKMHRLSIRFIKLEFVSIPALYTRKRPRRLPFDILFDITSFLPRPDLDNCQFVCKEMFYLIENHKTLALHNIHSAKLVTKGDFFCFGVFVEDNDNVKDFREKRCNMSVTQNLFYPLLRNTSINNLYIKRIDFTIIFDHFKAGITQCKPLSVRRIVFSAEKTDDLSRILELTERMLKIREYQIEVFSAPLMNRLLVEPVIYRSDKFIVHEQYHSKQHVLGELYQFLTHIPRPACNFTLRNMPNENEVNAFLDKIVENFIQSKDTSAYMKPALLVLHANPTELPRLFNSAAQQNINSAFEYEMPTLSSVYHFANKHNKHHLTVCFAITMFFPIKRIVYFELGKLTY